MIVVINSVCPSYPKKSIQLPSQEDLLLNFLVALDYDLEDPPLADLLRQYHKLQGSWLIVSPILWQSGHNDAQIIATSKSLQLDKSELDKIYNLYAKYLAIDGGILHYHSPHLWLLHVDNKPSLTAKPIYQILNKSLMPSLDKLDKSLYWQKFITESQMLFASYANTSINGVWLWGGAKLKEQSLRVAADKASYPLAEGSKAKLKLYQSNLSLKDLDLLFLQDLESLSQYHKKELIKKPTIWYWNNIAYKTWPNNLVRLWRNLIHAY